MILPKGYKISAPLNRILIVYQDLAAAMKHGSFTYAEDRRKPFVKSRHKDGLMKSRLRFNDTGKLIGWDLFDYVRATDSFSASVEHSKYHEVKVLDGTYSAQMVFQLIKGVSVKETFDTPVPDDI